MTTPITADKPIGYMIPVGEADKQRLDALGAIHNPRSVELITSRCQTQKPRILDVGCGNGSLTCLFAKTIRDSFVVGVDISPEQIAISKQKSAEEGLSNMSWDVCDVYKLEDLKQKYPDLFDIVHTRFVLTHVTDLPKAVDQLLTMVKPGGLLILEEVGAKKQFKETPVKAMQAWKAMVDMQYKLQKSHPDTVERVIEHIQQSDSVESYTTELFDMTIEGQLKKSMFRMGAEHGIKKFAEIKKPELIKTLGYEDGEAWLKDMRDFENDDTKTFVVEGNESIIAIKV